MSTEPAAFPSWSRIRELEAQRDALLAAAKAAMEALEQIESDSAPGWDWKGDAARRVMPKLNAAIALAEKP